MKIRRDFQPAFIGVDPCPSVVKKRSRAIAHCASPEGPKEVRRLTRKKFSGVLEGKVVW
jgi:hypothetical protein